MDTASKIIAEIGERAWVKVAEKGDAVKWASAHDLRRAFGFRWAGRIMPKDLMILMRHESITTTMEFYVGRNAEATAEVLWAAVNPAASPQRAPGSAELSEPSARIHQ